MRERFTHFQIHEIGADFIVTAFNKHYGRVKVAIFFYEYLAQQFIRMMGGKS